MKKIIFPYYISYGKGDNGDFSIEVSLTDEELRRLQESAEEGGHFHLIEDDDLADIYDKVYKKITSVIKKELQEDPEPVKTALSWEEGYDENAEITSRQISKYVKELDIGINYPEHYQFLEATKEKSNYKQSDCKSIILSKEEADLQLKSKDFANENVIYVDDGEELYWVPKNYSGIFTFLSTCRRAKYNAFKQRKKITEIRFEEGMETLPDWLFSECAALTTVIFPLSMRKIGFNSFFMCPKLHKIVMNEGLEVIDGSAFRGCGSIKELVIPETVKEISTWLTYYPHMFYQLERVTDIYIKGVNTIITGQHEQWAKICMHVQKGSKAEAFAQTNNILFQYIE